MLMDSDYGGDGNGIDNDGQDFCWKGSWKSNYIEAE